MKRTVLGAGSALIVGAVVSSGLAAVSPAPAHAVMPAIDEANLEAEVFADNGGNGCSTVESDLPVAAEHPADGNGSLTVNGSLEASGPGGDGTNDYEASGTLTSAVTVGEEDIFESLDATLFTDAIAGGDGLCNGHIGVRGQIEIRLELPRPGALTVDIETSPRESILLPSGGNATVRLVHYTDDYSYAIQTSLYGEGDQGLRTAGTKEVEAGHYGLVVSMESTLAHLSGIGGPSMFRGTTTANVSYEPDPAPGDAVSQTRGKAKKFVKLSAEVNCSTHKATAKFKKKAKKVKQQTKKVVFKAGKKTVKKVKGKKIKPGRKIKLKKVPAKTKKLKVIFKLKGGKKLKSKRKYVACS